MKFTECIEQGLRAVLAYWNMWWQVPLSSMVKLWGWLLGPLVVWLLLLAAGAYWGVVWLKALLEESNGDMWTWLQGGLILLSTVLLFMLISVLYRYTALIIAAPFISAMTGQIAKWLRVEGYLKNQRRSIWEDWYRGIAVALSTLWRELVWTSILIVLMLITGWGALFTPVLFVVQAYYAGVAHADYILEHFYDKRQTWRYVRMHRCAVFANGAVFLALLTVPCVGWILGEGLAAMAFAWFFLSTLAHRTQVDSRELF